MDIHIERTINRPAEDVAAFFLDVANNTKWQSGITSCEWTSEPPIGVGSTFEQVAEVRNKPVVSTFEVTEYEPGRRMRIESLKSNFPIQVTRVIEPVDDRTCRVTADVSGQPAITFRLLEKIGERAVKRSIEADYDRLVEHVEQT